MKIAKNTEGKIIHIMSSNSMDKYRCPCCNNELQRIFTPNRQYYKHPIGIGDECEKKIKDLGIEADIHVTEEDLQILEKYLYNKEFENMITEMSDVKSDEGYPLTTEQMNIINSTEDKIKVNSVAGSSKSTTLYYYAKNRPHKRILYLVYNASAKKEAEETFGKLRNVQIKTTHGLAFQYFGKSYIRKGAFKNTSIFDIVNILRLNRNRNEHVEIAIKVLDGFKKFLLSDSHDIMSFGRSLYKDDVDCYDISSSMKTVFEQHKDLNNRIPVPHDLYLKVFHLEKMDLSSEYDTILIDESQDSTLLINDVIKNSNVKNIVLVGDNRQKLYGWRDCVDIMSLFTEGKEYQLNTSFRVSNNIAYFSNLILNELGLDSMKMKGFNSKNIIVNHIDKSEPYAVLFRNNASIVEHCFENVTKDRKVLFVGGFDGYKFNLLLEAYDFKKTGRTKNKDFENFKNYFDMIEFSKKTENIEMLIIDRLIDTYGNEIPEKVKFIKENSTDDGSKAHIIISTGHRSKGSTIKRPLLIGNDFLKLTEAYGKILNQNDKQDFAKSILDELFVIYVVITRGANLIELNEDMKKFFIQYYKNNKDLFNKEMI